MNNLIPHFIHDQYLDGNRQGSFDAFAMFVDMSGFTRLTESLLQQGTVGAERLSDILNAIFGPMVSLVYQQGGFIPYFAGDAFIGIFPLSGCNCKAADVLAYAWEQFDLLDIASDGFRDFEIGIKTGLSFGEVEWGIVGRENLSFFFRGSAVLQCAKAQTFAKNQEVIVDEAFARQLPADLEVTPCNSGGFLKIRRQPLAFEAGSPAPLPALEADVVEKFLTDHVASFNQRGEFRNVVAVFISFEGTDDYDQLDQFATIVLDHAHGFSGYFKEIDFSDKGGVAVALFGAPVSFENNAERAIEFVYAVQDDLLPLQLTSDLKFKAGIAEGIAYTGMVGGVERSQYAAVGNRVNIAARLMMHASWSEVLVDAEVQKNRHFKFQHTGDITYKGLKSPIPTYRLVGRSTEQRQVFDGSMIGRERELVKLEDFAKTAFTNSVASVAYVYGEPGIGKTRLSYELRQRLRKISGLHWLVCQSDQMLRKPFNPFTYLLKNYFGQSYDNSPETNLEHFEQQYASLLKAIVAVQEPGDAETTKREIVRTKPVLAALSGLKTSNTIWENLDAKGRYLNTKAALSSLFQAEALRGPVVIELEDGHWFDESSIEFLNELVGRIKKRPILLLVTSRYDDEGAKPMLFKSEAFEKTGLPLLEIDLNILDSEAMLHFAKQRLNGGEIHADLLELLQRTTNGNPFYAEQMLEYFTESGLLKKEDGRWTVKDKFVRISNSIQAVLTARIDRLSSLVKETIKAAAVIGREFELPVLTEVMKGNEEMVQRNGNSQLLLKEQVKTAERAQIWQAMNELRYIFRHSLLREAVYDMQLKVRLRELHLHIAEAIERLYADQLEQRYVDLVFHYEQAEVTDKLRYYLKKAADHAKAHYQNQQALHFYRKLFDLQEAAGEVAGQAKTLLKEASVLELIGRWDECETLNRKALDLARQTTDGNLLGRANDSLGHLLMLKGKYEEADGYLETSAAFFGSAHDNRGTSKVYGHLGTLYFRQGKYEDAKLYFIKSIQLAQLYPHTTTTAQIVATLGLTYMNLGKYDDGIRWQRSQLETCKQVNDRQGMAALYTNLGIVHFEKGDYDDALACYEKGLVLAEELGNKQLISIAIGCIGSVWQRKGKFDIALRHFEHDLALTEELGDKQGISIALGLLGELFSVMGRFDEAIQYMERNLKLAEELGYRKGMAKSLNTLGDIYFYKNDFETSLAYYDRSIVTTKSIGNKLVLGLSLSEKAGVLLATGRVQEAAAHLKEVETIAQELQHPDLLFEVKLLAGRVAAEKGETAVAKAVFEELLIKSGNKKEEATLHFMLYRLEKSPSHREAARSLYRQLYEETPMFVFKLRIEELA